MKFVLTVGGLTRTCEAEFVKGASLDATVVVFGGELQGGVPWAPEEPSASDGFSEAVKARILCSAVASRVRDVVARRTLAMESGGISTSDIASVYASLFGTNVQEDIKRDPSLVDTDAALSLIDVLRCLPDVAEMSTPTGTPLYCIQAATSGLSTVVCTSGSTAGAADYDEEDVEL